MSIDSSEPLFGGYEVIKPGQRFPLFSDRTENLKGASISDATGYYTLAYRTPVVLDLGNMRIPFQVQFCPRDFKVVHTITPFDTIGYTVTDEDYDPHRRAAKLLSEISRYSMNYGEAAGYLHLSVSNLINPSSSTDYLQNPENFLKLRVETPKGRLIGFPMEAESKLLHIETFYPDDKRAIADILEMEEHPTVLHRLSEEFGVDSYQYQFVASATTWFDVVVPDDPAKLRTLTGEFFIDEPLYRIL